MWINANTLVTYEYQFQIRDDFPNTSLPEFLTDEFLATIDIYPVVPVPQPEYDWMTQNCTQGAPELVDGTWYQTWVVTEATPEEVEQRKAECQQQNKAEAEQLLKDTDWTATVDINNPQYSNPYLGNQDAFLAYRSQVRQIALNPPIVPAVFPEKPQEVWISV